LIHRGYVFNKINTRFIQVCAPWFTLKRRLVNVKLAGFAPVKTSGKHAKQFNLANSIWVNIQNSTHSKAISVVLKAVKWL